MKDMIWYERYRPKELADLVLPPDYRKLFKRYIKKKEIPHLLFFGPAGSGKTTLSQILISQCAGRSLILNASSEDRGINVIKTRVRQFATAKHSGELLNIIFFDEANGLTPDAQEALKNTIEKYHKNCRFIFTTNEFDKITEPIVSRCQAFRFDSFPKKKLTKRLHWILEQEQVKYKDKDLSKIISRYYPDIRTIMNTIQACSASGRLNIKLGLNVTDTKMIDLYITEGKIFALRHLFTGSKDFTWVYRHLFDNYVPKNYNDPTEACLVVAEYMWRDRGVVDKEINLAACFIELMNLNEVEIDFDEPF